MTLDKSCPGSRTIREPIPEYINCPSCGQEVEVWTDELKATCPNCGTRIFREQEVSCIDWCPHAKECVGPEVYERLRPGLQEDLSGTPLDVLRREHERVLENLSLLRGAGLCLKLGSSKPQSPIWDKGVSHLTKVLEFFDKDVGLHFRREEEVLFPSLERHIEGDRSPTRLLLGEHHEIWQWYHRLKEKLIEAQEDRTERAESVSAEVQDIINQMVPFLQEHIKKENESLLPLARSLLGQEELEEISRRWRSLGVGIGDRE